ncbi:hypothetical protein QJS10_CPB20g01816 [Acorus calamus]|uniref:Embryo defective 1703 n=1 Tax=Acorus calamus TaxID=4465 RepID=A0AAV9C9B1_ACOCL|nr:hypothetical protein QJS10_CPB20g01816 [Acorus calamus]
MDAFSASVLQKTDFLGRGASPFRANPLSSIRLRKNPSRVRIPGSDSLPKIPFWVSASFGRNPRPRRNSLREKLVPVKEQVSDYTDPNYDFRSLYEVSGENLNLGLNSHVGDVKDVFLSDGVGELGSVSVDSGGSVMWDRLEGWVNQYKKDSEFWGIGSGPIFTVFQDSKGKINKVLVDESEVVRRSRIKAWSLDQEGSSSEEELKDVNQKISRAKLVAREMEEGLYELPKNSNVVKFVVEGSKKSSFSDGFRSVSLSLPRELLPKVSQTGLAVLVGCFLLLAFKKFLIGDDGLELTAEEQEMLRRKMKSRVERGDVVKGDVEVIQNESDSSSVVLKERPRLDKDELMQSISKSKASSNTLMISDSATGASRDTDFDMKIREIQEMARRAREAEKQDLSQVDDNKVEDVEFDSDLSSKAHLNMKGSDSTGVSEIDLLVDCTGNNKLSADMKENKAQEVIGGNSPNSVAGGDLINIDANKGSSEMPLEIDKGNSDTKIAGEQNEVELLTLDTSGRREMNESSYSSSNKSSSSSDRSVREKPKIIRSVKEARKFLSERRMNEGKEKHQVLDRGPHASPIDHGESCDENSNGKPIQRIKKNNLTLESLNILKGEKSNPKSSSNTEEIPLVNSPNSDHVSEIENALGDTNKEKLSLETENNRLHRKEFMHSLVGDKTIIPDVDNLRKHEFIEEPVESKTGASSQMSPVVDSTDGESQINGWPSSEKDECKFKQDIFERQRTDLHASSAGKEIQFHKMSYNEPSSSKAPSSNKPMITKSVEEANAPANKEQPDQELGVVGAIDPVIGSDGSNKKLNGITRNSIGLDKKELKLSKPEDSSEGFTSKGQESGESPEDLSSNNLDGDRSWIEKNYHELEPIVKKIGDGFRESYMVAKEKAKDVTDLSTKITELGFNGDDDEMEWMKDGNLRDIVFRVRDNELSGRDPFHKMAAEDKQAFFVGLEKKAEKVNKKLSGLHEWVHSKIENLDYGADGISLDDPLEKVIPRWRGPPVNEDPVFLNNFASHQNASPDGKGEILHAPNGDAKAAPQSPEKLPTANDSNTKSRSYGTRKISRKRVSTDPKTLIQCSDGSVRAGKKFGKENWQHTKKWTQGFLEVYNAQTDPEVKSVMKDMGKDLDRWMMEKEVQEVADLMDKIPKRKRRYIEKKMDKLKKEMEMFGPQAVVSKYREYSEEREEDYLWWLDLPHVLCIELYTTENGVQNVGFYSLEMVADLELSQKQHHVIAFEDPGDSKHFCYIIQAHLEMLGIGNAFVVARPPKTGDAKPAESIPSVFTLFKAWDAPGCSETRLVEFKKGVMFPFGEDSNNRSPTDAFREAKANGFNVTVIRKGQLQLNVDQTLEEVEEEITEIGSKMYHDKFMSERSIDMDTLMKGVFGSPSRKSTKRRPKSKGSRRKPTKS